MTDPMTDPAAPENDLLAAITALVEAVAAEHPSWDPIGPVTPAAADDPPGAVVIHDMTGWGRRQVMTATLEQAGYRVDRIFRLDGGPHTLVVYPPGAP